MIETFKSLAEMCLWLRLLVAIGRADEAMAWVLELAAGLAEVLGPYLRMSY